MHPRTVIALGVVFHQNLPVCLDVVFDALSAGEPGKIEPGEEVGQTPERLRQRFGIGGDVEEDEALPDSEPGRIEPIFDWIEIDQRIGMPGVMEFAVEIVDPGMVGALKRTSWPCGSVTTSDPRCRQTLKKARISPSLPRTTMIASPATSVRKYDPFSGRSISSADAMPAAGEPFFPLPGEDFGIVIDDGGESCGAERLRANRRDVVGIDRCARSDGGRASGAIDHGNDSSGERDRATSQSTPDDRIQGG